MVNGEATDWIKGSRRGDKEAVRELSLFLREKRSGWWPRVVPRWIEEADLFDEVLVAVLERLRKKRKRRNGEPVSRQPRRTRITGAESLLAFAGQEAERILGRWKRRAHRTRTIFDFRQFPVPDPDAATPGAAASPGVVEVLRGKLSPTEFRLFTLRYLRGQIGQKLAQRVGISSHELSCRLWRLKAKLRRWLGPERLDETPL